MKLEFLAPAEAEFANAISYYNKQSEGLGFEFASEERERWKELFNFQMHGITFQSVPADAELIGFLMVLFIKREQK